MTSKEDKHPFAIGGKIYTPKRKRSQEEEVERKREKQGNRSVSSVEENSEEEMKEVTQPHPNSNPFLTTNTQSQGGNDEFVTKFITALRNEQVMGLLTAGFNQAIDTKIEPIQEDIRLIEESNKFRDERINVMERKIDEYEQRDRDRNIIVTGLKDNETSVEDVTKKLSKLHFTIHAQDIQYVQKLRTTKGPARVKVVFKEEAAKMQIMKSKKKLKGHNDTVWIADDLTQYRSKLAFLARSSVKEGNITQTWTFNSKVFIKELPTSKPKRVLKPEDIPGLEPEEE